MNVAAALAAGLDWPVAGSNFYNKRAKSVLQVGAAGQGGCRQG